VWEDGGYGLITWKQEVEFGRHFGTDFATPDFLRIAEGFGCHAQRVEKPDDLRPLLREAFGITDRPSVIVVPVDYGENLKLTRRLGDLVAH
jgi:acetolactate synthase-1/2/3 large subunit